MEEHHEFDEEAHEQQMMAYQEDLDDDQSVSTATSAKSGVIRIRELYSTNTKFRADIKKLKAESRACAQPRKAFLAIMRRKKEEFDTFLSPLLTQIRAYKAEKLREVKESAEYKQLQSKESAYNRRCSKLWTQYRVREWHLHYLSNQRGMRNFYARRYRGSSRYLLYRAFPRRLRL